MSLSHQRVAVRGVSKRFGSTQALLAVDFEVAPGEVVGLMGANGAGKSTLVNVLVGAVRPDEGVMIVEGRPYAPAFPRDAIAAGIVAIHQATDRAGAAGLTVAETLLLDRFADGRSGFFVGPPRSAAAPRRSRIAPGSRCRSIAISPTSAQPNSSSSRSRGRSRPMRAC